jgi:hypothetical protein
MHVPVYQMMSVKGSQDIEQSVYSYIQFDPPREDPG